LDQKQTIKVLIVAVPGDRHADAVEKELAQLRVSTFRISLNTLRSSQLSWTPDGDLVFHYKNVEQKINSSTTIWWRRPGGVDTSDFEWNEARLIEAECFFTLRGTLAGTGARWVDSPFSIELAENKIYQLNVAYKLGVQIPNSLLTNVPVFAKQLATPKGIIAKSISVGPGLAPFVQKVPANLLDSVSVAPVLLQELLEAIEDVRVITIGSQTFAWRRKKLPNEPVDWRAADPEGGTFYSFEADSELQHSALKIANSLGLSTTVQDWLLTDRGHFFLEVNPQGQWLFLKEAETILLPIFTRHLII
jgi:glutathione synthase/RimK-type ligase-like ATP-grasp enzyme